MLEVETPLLGSSPVTDVHLASFATDYEGPGVADGEGATLHLATSPELAMKRLLAAGSGPIFQIGKAFRNGEFGHQHNPEFTIVEWYRPGWDHHRLMEEVAALLSDTLGTSESERHEYGDLFNRHTGIDPHEPDRQVLDQALSDQGLRGLAHTEDDAIQALFTALVEPHLGRNHPTFVYDFPLGQAALARIRDGIPRSRSASSSTTRALELANGFHELCDAVEQRRRFEADRQERLERGLAEVHFDERFLGALQEGLPACAGVALGFDRLLMSRIGAEDIRDVLAFPIDRA